MRAFRWKINQDVSKNGKLFWKELIKVNGRKVENCSRIKKENRRLIMGEEELRGLRRIILRVFII